MQNTSKILISLLVLAPLSLQAATLQEAFQSALQRNEVVGIAKEQVIRAK